MKKFTLIELITVIVVTSILASIVLINVSNLREKANVSAIQSNVHSLQKAVNIYMSKNNSEIPSEREVSLGKPSSIDYQILYSEYIKNKPEEKKAYYWIDYQGLVWGGTIDIPTEFVIKESNVAEGFSFFPKAYADEKNKVLSWDEVQGASYYNVYTLDPKEKNQLILLGETMESNYVFEENIKEDEIFISVVDKHEFKTPPILLTREQLVEDENNEEEIEEEIEEEYQSNEPPKVQLFLKNGTEFSYIDTPVFTTKYTDPEGEINPIAEEFYLNEKLTNFVEINKKLSAGNYLVKYRAKDSHGNWSEFASINFNVIDKPPIVTLKLNETTKLTNANRLTFSKTLVDPEGITRLQVNEFLVDGEKKSNIDGYYTAGTHTIKYRARDSNGVWSNQVSIQFKVEDVSSSNFAWQYTVGGVTTQISANDLVVARKCACATAGRPNLTLVSKIGNVDVEITGAGYGTNAFPHTSSTSAGDIKKYNQKTINATINQLGGFDISFSYSDTFVHLTKIKASSTITYIK